MRAPEVGIIYLAGDKLWIDATLVARGMNVGDFVIHERDHCQYWRQLVKKGVVPDTGYERFPRGRVTYNKKSGRFTLLADRCILREKSVVSTIFSRMNLLERNTETGTDRFYRCHQCSGRSR